MPIRFEIRILNTELTTFDALKLEISLENPDATAAEIPSPDDSSGALSIRVYYRDGTLLREMDGITRQLMRSKSRVNTAYTLAPLEPGQAWRWTVDFAKYHYTMPEGEFEVQGVFEYPPLDLHLETPRLPIRVAPLEMRSLQDVRDNPVLDRIELLMNAGSNGTFYLRQYAAKLPLAAFYNERLSSPDRVFCATANFFQTASFEPVSRRWILMVRDRRLVAMQLAAGVPTGQERGADLPEGRSAAGFAYYTEDDRLFVFLTVEPNIIESWEFGQGPLENVFRHTLSAGRARDAHIYVDQDSIHIVVPWGGVFYELLTLAGESGASRRLYRTGLKPRDWSFDTVDRRINALFWDAPHGRAVEMFTQNFREGTNRRMQLDSLGLKSPIRELSFAPDRSERFHLLASAANGRLYYFKDGKGPMLIAEGEERFLPKVVADRQVFLGCYRRRFGYRFLALSDAQFEARFLEFENTR